MGEFLAQVLPGANRLPEIVGIWTEGIERYALVGNRLQLGNHFVVDLLEPVAVTLAVEVERLSPLPLLVSPLLALIQHPAP